VTGTPRSCYRSISIIADGRLEVCDGAHWAFVMKGCDALMRANSQTLPERLAVVAGDNGKARPSVSL
jgi:hypothetical protein